MFSKNFFKKGKNKNYYYDSDKRNPYKEQTPSRKYAKGGSLVADQADMKDIFYYSNGIAGMEIL